MGKTKDNSDLHQAKINAADEFYTADEDVAVEMQCYDFRGKSVYLPCDDNHSAFWRYFHDNFEQLGLTKLCATSWSGSEDSCGFCYYKDANGELASTISTIDITTGEHVGPVNDGSYEKNLHLMDQYDVIVTNPPFSKFRDFIRTLFEHNKKFIILGNLNAVTYREVFPHIVNGELRLGETIHSGDREFRVPEYYPLKGTAVRTDEDGNQFIRVKGVRWFTNYFDHCISHREPSQRILKWKKDNVFSLKEFKQHYRWFDTYPALNVDSMKEIPVNFDHKIGAPITVIDKMGADGLLHFRSEDGKDITFLIEGMLNSGNHPEYFDFEKPIVEGKMKFKRLIIRKVYKYKGI